MRLHPLLRLAARLLPLSLCAAPVAAQDAGLALPNESHWGATVSEAQGVSDPAWTTIVYVRRAAAGESKPSHLGRGPNAAKPGSATHELDGIASYYWQGQVTASGEAFDKRALTAAHKTLPMGSVVKVTNLGNGRSTVVRINDRGPFVPGRVIDVSEAAADALGMRSSGLAPVRVDLVQN